MSTEVATVVPSTSHIAYQSAFDGACTTGDSMANDMLAGLYSNADEEVVPPALPATTAPIALISKFDNMKVSKCNGNLDMKLDGQLQKDTFSMGSGFSVVGLGSSLSVTAPDVITSTSPTNGVVASAEIASIMADTSPTFAKTAVESVKHLPGSAYHKVAADSPAASAAVGHANNAAEDLPNPNQVVDLEPNNQLTLTTISSGASPAENNLDEKVVQHSHEKSASEEVLALYQRQSFAVKLPFQATPEVSTASDALNFSVLPALSSAAVGNGITATAPSALENEYLYANFMEGGALTAPVTATSPPEGYPAEKPASFTVLMDKSDTGAGQLDYLQAERARLAAALKSAQNACARKDEQILDLQRRDGMLVQQYIQLQNMYQGLLDQLQREQQQWANNSAQLQGELRTKQNVEELTKLLTNQLRQEQRQKKSIMMQLQTESAARQQAQEHAAAAKAQVQQLQQTTEAMQWLQNAKVKLQNDLNAATSQLQIERQRRSDGALQLQAALAEKQRMKEELVGLRGQLQQYRMRGATMDMKAPMMHNQLGAGAGGFPGHQLEMTDNSMAYSQAGPYVPAYQDSDMHYSRMATSGHMPGSPTGYLVRAPASMAMPMQEPMLYTGMTKMGPF